jgi:hypothetical protein
VRRKILILTLILLVTFILPILPIQAAPTEKEVFTLYYEATVVTDFNPVGLSHAGPKKSEGMDYPYQKTYHGRGITQDVLYSELVIGDPYTDPIIVESETAFEFNWKTMIAVHKAKTTISFEGIEGTIEISVIEKLNYMTFVSEGTFVGHGTDSLEGVKVVGTSFGEGGGWIEIFPGVWMPTIVEVTLDGTIMGWD